MGGSQKTVIITKTDGAISVDPICVQLSISNEDSIVWSINPRTEQFLVCFGNKSPFAGSHFTNQHCESGPIRNVPGQGHDVEFFKYSVEVGTLKVDPGVIIKQ
jgi:hypothetical protein